MLSKLIEVNKEIKIANVVCTADLKQSVAIERFNEYNFLSSNLTLYKCGYVKDNKMQGRVTVFASGKLISVGTKSPKQAHSELKKASKILHDYNLIKSYKIEPIIRNIVSSVNLNKNIDIHKLARILPRSIYEPEQFAALIYRVHGSVVALIFASGRIVLVGAKSISELNTAFFEVKQRITR